MFLELADLFWLTLLVLFLMYWWRAQKVKEIALSAASKYCREMDIQLLDQSIYLRGFWLKRDDDGRVKVWRSYLFDFTATGEDRAKGRVVMLGNRITGIYLDPHRI